MHIDVRVLGLEVALQRRQHVLGNGGTGANDQYTADLAGHVPYRVVHFGVQVKDLVGVLVDTHAGIGQADTVVGTVEQAGVELFLQLAHLEGDRRLGHVQAFRGLGETQQSGNGMKNL